MQTATTSSGTLPFPLGHFPFEVFLPSFCNHNSCFNSFVSGLATSCSDLRHGFQLQITRSRSILSGFLFVHGQYCLELIRLLCLHFVQTFENLITGNFTCAEPDLVSKTSVSSSCALILNRSVESRTASCAAITQTCSWITYENCLPRRNHLPSVPFAPPD